MIYSTATLPVNPEGASPLTREQTWKGLELKARDAREFLPPGLADLFHIGDVQIDQIAKGIQTGDP
jgi:hypothetical protein